MAQTFTRYPFRDDHLRHVVDSQNSIIRNIVVSEQVRRVKKLSVAEYAALSSPDPSTLYLRIAQPPGVGAATGAATVQGIGKAAWRVAGSAVGAAAVQGIGKATAIATGASSASAASSGVGLSAYRANSVRFDGTNDFLQRGGSLTGAVNSKTFTFACWVKKNGANGGTYSMLTADNTDFIVNITSNDAFLFFARDSGGTLILTMTSANDTVEQSDGWVGVLCSVDMSNVAKRHMYIGDTDVFNSATTYTDAEINFATSDWFVGRHPTSGLFLNADVADLWFLPGAYTDFSVEANRRKFIDANGKPVLLGNDGSTPTGSAPLVYLSGGTDAWHTNKGGGGGFTENGALTDGPTSPSD